MHLLVMSLLVKSSVASTEDTQIHFIELKSYLQQWGGYSCWIDV